MNNNKVKYPFVIYPAEEGGCVAEIPALKGYPAQGETLKETLDELETVASLWIATAQMHRETLPNAEVEIEKVKQKLAA